MHLCTYCRKATKIREQMKKPCTPIFYFEEQKTNNHILTTLEAIPNLHVAYRQNIFEFKMGSEQ